MPKRRHLWSQGGYRLRGIEDEQANKHATSFRSDNDIKALKHAWVLMSLVTASSFMIIEAWDVPLRYSVLGFVPAILIFGIVRWCAWYDRKRGKRFRHYNDG